MSPGDDHNRAIAATAKAVLAPLGFRRKGQSRTWLADHGYWLLGVEFQPSAWSKGSYLNVAAHWLWHPPSLTEPHFYLSFDFSRQGFSRVADFVSLEKSEEYGSVTALAQAAAVEARALRSVLPSLDACAEALIAAERARPADRPPSWGAYDAAVAAALTGRGDMAVALLKAILTTPKQDGWALHPSAEALLMLAGDPAAVRASVTEAIHARRAAYRLPALPAHFE